MMEDHNHNLVTQFTGSTVLVNFANEEEPILGKVLSVRGRWLEIEPHEFSNVHGKQTVHRVVNLDHVKEITHTVKEKE